MNVHQEGIRPPIARIEHSTGCVALPLGVVYVGRGGGCLLRVDDPAVSRIHLMLEVGEEVVVRDLGSKNGALLNGERLVGSRTLADGDVIELGKRTLRVHIEAADPEDHEEETPALRTGTLAGVGGAVQVDQQCPECEAKVSLEARDCPRCGFRWRRGNPSAPTESINEAVEKQPPEQERRASPRYPMAFAAHYRGKQHLECQARDISCGGVFLACDTFDEPGTPCEVKIVPPDTVSATFAGRVVRAASEDLGGVAGMAIQFRPLEGEQLRWLAQLLLRRLGDSEEPVGSA